MPRSLHLTTFGSLLAWAAVVAATPATAQTAADDREASPAHVVRISGEVELAQEASSTALEVGWVLEPGDRIRTRAGRSELRWDDGRSLFIDGETDVEMLDTALLRLNGGAVIVSLERLSPEAPSRVRIDSPSGSTELQAPGRYRVALREDEDGSRVMDVTAVRGQARVASLESEVMPLDAGERTSVREGHPPALPVAVNVVTLDAFDRFASATPIDTRAFRTATSGALPPGLQAYSPVLDDYGAWEVDDTYGRVWFPRVLPDWRPYTYGRWQQARAYGSVWIGDAPWSWPTHHYGRWGVRASGRWFWIPSAGWSSAWVEWSIAPDYLGWCPLGWDGSPIVSWSAVGSWSPYDPRGRYASRGYLDARGVYDPWRAWTVVPRASFFGARNLGNVRVGREHFRSTDLPAFVTSRHLPSAIRATHDAVRVPGATRGVGLDPRDSRATTRPTSAAPAGPPPLPWAVARPREESPYERADRVVREGRWPSGTSPQDQDPYPDASRTSVRRAAPLPYPRAYQPTSEDTAPDGRGRVPAYRRPMSGVSQPGVAPVVRPDDTRTPVDESRAVPVARPRPEPQADEGARRPDPQGANGGNRAVPVERAPRRPSEGGDGAPSVVRAAPRAEPAPGGRAPKAGGHDSGSGRHTAGGTRPRQR